MEELQTQLPNSSEEDHEAEGVSETDHLPECVEQGASWPQRAVKFQPLNLSLDQQVNLSVCP